MDNLTLVEDDAFANLIPAPNALDSPAATVVTWHTWIFLAGILKGSVCACSAAAAAFLIHTILKYNLLSSRPNTFLLHYAITCAADMLIRITLMLLPAAHYTCTIFKVSVTLNVISLLFAVTLGAVWYVQTRKFAQKKNFVKYVVFVLYGICAVKTTAGVVQCFVESLHANFIILFSYFMMVLKVVVVNVAARRKPLSVVHVETKYQLTVSTYIVLSYFPLFVFYLITDFFVTSTNVMELLVNILRALEIVAYSGPIVVVYLLGRKSEDFKEAYDESLKKLRKKKRDDALGEAREDDKINRRESANSYTC